MEYSIEKHVTTEFVVMAKAEGDNIKCCVAHCPSEGIALTIKGLYEKAEREDENPKVC